MPQRRLGIRECPLLRLALLLALSQVMALLLAIALHLAMSQTLALLLSMALHLALLLLLSWPSPLLVPFDFRGISSLALCTDASHAGHGLPMQMRRSLRLRPGGVRRVAGSFQPSAMIGSNASALCAGKTET